MKFHRDFEADIPTLNDKVIELLNIKAKKNLAALKYEYEEEAGEKKDIQFYEVFIFVNGVEKQLFKYEA